jgi:hypothetical protein
MNLHISEFDRHNIIRAAILKVANFHKIADCEYKSSKELYDEIAQKNSPLFESLNNYLDSFTKWFRFYHKKQNMEQKTGKIYNFNEAELKELETLLTDKNKNLDNLQIQHTLQKIN